MHCSARLLLALLAATIAGPTAAESKNGKLAPVSDDYEVSKALKGEDGEEPYDVSGIACGPPRDGKPLHCLLVNDEGASAQAVKIEAGRIKPGRAVALTDTDPNKGPYGVTPTKNRCPPPKDDMEDASRKPEDEEFDGEGVAFADGYYYVVGSHGCSRKKGAFKLSSLRLARVRADEKGKVAEGARVETTFRLAEALEHAAPVKDYYLKGLGERSNGLNVEGVAVVAGRLYAGLRAPSLNGRAFLVSVPVDALFVDDSTPLKRDGLKVVALDVGEDAGIRDLASAPDGKRLVVLTGPAQEQPEVGAKLWVADPVTGATLLLGALKKLGDKERCGKAEAVTVVEPNRVLVLFDSLPSGGPHAYDVKLGQ